MHRVFIMTALLVGGGCFVRGEEPKTAPMKDPVLRLELLQRVKVDQDARMSITQWMRQFGHNGIVDTATLTAARKAEYAKLADSAQRIDAENTKRMTKIVEHHGWPTRTLVGNDGAHAAWLLIQHADLSPKFQRKCLDMMVKLPKDEVSQKDVAYLTDRVLLAEGKKQVFGTQFTVADGKWRPLPLEDEQNVDKRRAEVGLPPLAEYVKDLEAHYGNGPNK